MKMRLIEKIFVLLLCCHVAAFGQQRDSRVREYLTPTRIVWQKGDSLINLSKLLQKGNGQSVTNADSLCIIKSTNTDHPAILLDFGKEIQGGLQIVTGPTASKAPITLRVRFGESASEAMSEIDTIGGATNDHALRDYLVQVPWLGVAETGNSGFRFVRIDIVSDPAVLLLKEIRAISIFRDIPELGSFRCNDELLNRIWQVGKETVHLNMQEYLWDGIKRDRLVWIGDMYPELMTIQSVYGYNEVLPKSIDLARDLFPVPQWINGISSYSLWWLIIQHEYYNFYGDKNYLRQQLPYLQGLLRLIISKVDKKGMEQLDGMRFLDWPSSESPEAIHAGLQSLTMIALKRGSELCKILGDEPLASSCDSTYQKMLKAKPSLLKTFDKAKLSPTAPGTKQAASLLSLSGLMPAKEANEKYISVDSVQCFSTYFGYYMLRAMAEAGDYQNALNDIRTYWGAMLDLGATTFWEDFNINWMKNAARIDELVPAGKVDVHKTYGGYCYMKFRHSLCHGWASGPTAWMSRYVLGIEIAEPGCKAVRIVPHLGDLQWAEGSFPTPYGVIKVRHTKKSDGTIDTELSCPKEITVIK